MSDVLFITPNLEGHIRYEHIGTLLLATILRNKGITPTILQYFRFGDAHNDFPGFIDNALEQICAQDPKIVSFYTRCDTYHVSILLAQKLKERLPDTYVVFGGPQSDICAEETIAQIPQVDFVCCGEGENTVYPLFSSLLNKQPDLSVPGLVYRHNGEICKNPRPALVDLDTLPEIDYSFFPLPKTCDDKTVFSIDVGRGCPFGCTYCSTNTFWGRKYRLKRPERIVREVQSLHRLFGISNFTFEHDMFTMKRDQVIETCRLLKELDFPITWKCSARLDCIDKELIDIMADSGLDGIFFGIETGSPRMQKLIHKNLKLDGIMDTLSYIHSKGIFITASFIFGFPEENEEDISHTISTIGKIMRLKDSVAQTHLCTFLPGTELTRRYRDQLTMSSIPSDVTDDIGLHECRDIINNHPALFPQFLEYTTPLRTELQFLPAFVYMWRNFQPVFQYISEKYEHTRLIEMYRDFARENLPILEQYEDIEDEEKFHALLQHDRFLYLFKQDENYDLITDFRRIKLIESCKEVKNGSSVTDIFCFSPAQIQQGSRLQDYTRGIYAVTYSKNPDDTLNIRIRSMQKR